MDRANLLFGKVLNDVHNADVSVMRTFRKYVGYALVGLVHEVVDDQ